MLNSKKTSLLILGTTSVVCSRVMFSFFNDPEGPNLLVVIEHQQYFDWGIIGDHIMKRALELLSKSNNEF